MRLLLALMICLGTAAAEPVIDFEDPAGDHETMGTAPVGGDSVDIREIGVALDGEDVVATVTVADLGQVSDTDNGVLADTMFIVRWHAEGDGRSGEWSLRGDYQPANEPAWSFWGEGPCLDGDDSDGCAGEDRDIIDDLDGEADLDGNTVSIRIPIALLGDLPAQTWSDFHATVQQIWPTYPVTTVDWAFAPEDETRTFEAAPPEDEATQDGGADDGADDKADDGADDEAQGEDQDADEGEDGQSADEQEDESPVRVANPGNGAPPTATVDESPGTAVIALIGIAIAAFFTRR